MLKKWKRWLWERYLPVYCRDALLAEHERLRGALNSKDGELRELRAYTRGLEAALRAVCRRRVCRHKEAE